MLDPVPAFVGLTVQWERLTKQRMTPVCRWAQLWEVLTVNDCLLLEALIKVLRGKGGDLGISEKACQCNWHLNWALRGMHGRWRLYGKRNPKLFIYSFTKYLLSTCYVPGTVPCASEQSWPKKTQKNKKTLPSQSYILVECLQAFIYLGAVIMHLSDAFDFNNRKHKWLKQ